MLNAARTLARTFSRSRLTFLIVFPRGSPGWVFPLFSRALLFLVPLSHPVQDKEAVLSDDGKIMPRSAHVGDMIISYNGCGYRRIDPVWLSSGTTGPFLNDAFVASVNRRGVYVK